MILLKTVLIAAFLAAFVALCCAFEMEPESIADAWGLGSPHVPACIAGSAAATITNCVAR
jgi:hypothetical protein